MLIFPNTSSSGSGSGSGRRPFPVLVSKQSHKATDDSETTRYLPIDSETCAPRVKSGNSEPLAWTAVVFPDRYAELSRRLLRSLSKTTVQPAEIVEIPPPGIFPEQKAWQSILPRLQSPFLAHLDADMVLDPLAPMVIMKHFQDAQTACVAALLRDPINDVEGYVRFWRTEMLKKVIEDSTFDAVMPDTSALGAAEQRGWRIRRIEYIAGEHGIILDPWNIFRIYFRMGVKQRARKRLRKPGAYSGIRNALRSGTGWAHIAVLAFHTGIQVDFDGDPHNADWDRFAYERYAQVQDFCEMLADTEHSKSALQDVRDRRMRVLFATHSLRMGGVENAIINLAGNLDRERFEPSVAYECDSDPILLHKLRKNGISGTNLSDLGPTSNEAAWYSFLRKKRPDLIVTNLYCKIYNPAAALNIPLIERIPGWNGHSHVHKGYFDRVVCQYSGMRDALLARPEYQAREDRTSVIPNGIDFRRFVYRDKEEARQRAGIRAGAFVILAVARIDKVKNLSTLIRALAKLQARGVDGELHLLGRCESREEILEREYLSEIADVIKVRDRVYFHPPVSDVSDYYYAADVVSLSSTTEGTPNCLLEAAACERPIVASDVGGIRESLGDGAAYVEDPFNEEGFADALYNVYRSSDKRVSYSIQGHGRRKVTHKWEELFEQVYAERHNDLPYSVQDGRLRIGLLLDSLTIGGMEMFAKIFDRHIDREKFQVFIYSSTDGPLSACLANKIRIVSALNENGRTNLLKWMCRDRLDAALLVSCQMQDFFLKKFKPCPLIERLDGLFVARRCAPGTPDLVIHQSPTLMERSKATEPGILILNARELDVYRPDREKRSRFREALDIPESTFLIANVGRLCSQKNQVQLVRLARILKDRGITNLVIGLMGPDNVTSGSRTTIELNIEHLQVNSEVRIIEASVDNVSGFLAAADLYVHTASDEGLSGALIEAAATGLPIVATDCGAVHEIVSPENGSIVPVNDDASLANAVISYIEDESKLRLAGEASLTIAQKYDAVHMVREYEKAFVALIHKDRERRSRMPPVTIVMAVHNRTEYLQRAIESVLEQSFENWKMLIVPGTKELSEELIGLLSSFKDSRIVTLTDLTKWNHCAAYNLAFRLAESEYCLRLDSDDWLSPIALSEVVQHLELHPEADYLYSSHRLVHEGDRKKDHTVMAEDFDPLRLEEWHIAHQATVIRKKAFLLVDGYDVNIRYGEDYDLALRMMLNGARFRPIKEVLYFYRVHLKDRISAEKSEAQQKQCIQRVRTKYQKLKQGMGVTWAGEEPSRMAPRRRVREAPHA